MYKSVWHIIKKECARFFKDRRTVFFVVLLPAILMFSMYSLMGIGLDAANSVDEDYRFQCYVQNAPESYAAVFDSVAFDVINADDVQAAKDSVADKDADLLVIFPADFDNLLQNPSADGTVPDIQVYYNRDSTKSQIAYDLFLDATQQIEDSIVNIFDINRDVDNPNLAKSSSFMLSMMPSMIILTLFSSCTSVAPESIAGEKERGTFATLLTTPIRRSSIAIGKIISLSFFALLGGLSDFAGMLFGMRYMMPEEAGSLLPKLAFTEYAWLLLLIVSAVLMAISLISVISAFAKTVKEASASAAITFILASLGGFATTLPFAPTALWRCVPIIGTALSLNDILLMDYSATNLAITCVTNLVVTVALLITLTKMFNSEKIMFKKA